MNYIVEEILELKPDVSAEDQDLIKKAFLYSKKAHHDQQRNSGEPYFNHVFHTAIILAQMNADAITISAGILHDVLEDTDTQEDELRKVFGDEILYFCLCELYFLTIFLDEVL